MAKTLPLFVLCLTVFISCEKDDSENGIAISDITATENGVLIEWNKAKTNDFLYYEVLRSYDGVHFNTVNNIDSLNSPAYNVNYTRYNDFYARGKWPNWKLYYKVAVIGRNGNEVMLSNKVALDTHQPFNMPIRARKAYLIPDKKQLLFFENEWTNSQIYLYDYNNNKILQQKQLNIYSTGDSYGFGKYGDTNEFYFYDGYKSVLNIIDVHTMQEVASVPFDGSYAELITDDKGHIYYTDLNGVVMLDRNTLTKSYYSLGARIDDIHYSADLQSLFGINRSPSGIWRMELDDSGQIIADTKWPFEEDFEIQFMRGSDFAVFKKHPFGSEYGVINLKDGSTQILNSGFKDFSTFYMKENVLYASAYDFFNQQQTIYCYPAKDNFRLAKSIPIGINPTQLIIDDDNYLIMFEYNNSHANIMDKIKLVED